MPLRPANSSIAPRRGTSGIGCLRRNAPGATAVRRIASSVAATILAHTAALSTGFTALLKAVIGADLNDSRLGRAWGRIAPWVRHGRNSDCRQPKKCDCQDRFRYDHHFEKSNTISVKSDFRFGLRESQCRFSCLMESSSVHSLCGAAAGVVLTGRSSDLDGA